jgi:hypothetical protein
MAKLSVMLTMSDQKAKSEWQDARMMFEKALL